MSGLQLLRRLLAIPSADPAQDEVLRLPPHELRFALEYPQAPDIAREKQALAALFETSGFTLQPLFGGDDGELGRILVLRFPAIERTLSREVLFSIAYELADARGLLAGLSSVQGAVLFASYLGFGGLCAGIGFPMGAAVFSGMIGVTAFGLFLTPVFYVLLRRLTGNRPLKLHGEIPHTEAFAGSTAMAGGKLKEIE